MPLPEFDPSKPFENDEKPLPAFDPSQAFEEVKPKAKAVSVTTKPTIAKPSSVRQTSAVPQPRGPSAPIAGGSDPVNAWDATPKSDNIALDDPQGDKAQEYQSYMFHQAPRSKRSDAEEAAYVYKKFPELFGTDDPKLKAMRLNQIKQGVQYYRSGGVDNLGLYTNPENVPDAITVTADKGQLQEARANKEAEKNLFINAGHSLYDVADSVGGGIDKTFQGLTRLIAKGTDAVGITDNKDQELAREFGDMNDKAERIYYNPGGKSQALGEFVGSNAAFLPLAELTPATKLLGAGGLAAGGDMAAQGALMSEINSGGDASLQDVIGEASLAAIVGGLLHGRGPKEIGDRYGQRQPREGETSTPVSTYDQDVELLRGIGVAPEDLPTGVTPTDAVDALLKAKHLKNQAESFKGTPEPTPETAFKNPEGDLKSLEQRLAAEAEAFSGKPLDDGTVPTEPVQPDESGISKKEANKLYEQETAAPVKLTPKQMEAKLKAEADAFVNRDGAAASSTGPEASQEAPKSGSSEEPAPEEPQASQAPDPDEVSSRLIEELEKAGKARPEQEALYKQERAARAARAKAIPAHIQGKERSDLRKQIMSGELPKADFEAVGDKFTPEEIDSLHAKINNSNLGEYDQLTAVRGLEKLLQGTLPASSELSKLSEIFSPEFVKAVVKHRSILAKSTNLFENFAGSLKSIAATMDLSAPLRQGAPLIHRKEYWSAFANMFRYATSTKAFNELENGIRARPNYNRMMESGLFLAEHGHSLAAREEQFMDTWVSKLPFIKHSNQAYTGFLNKLRADTFDALVNKAEAAGLPVNDADIAHYINVATGRGRLGAAEKYAVGLNTVFFSPRFLSSRITMLNPMYYAKLDPLVRREAIKSLVAYGSVATSALALARQAGLDVSFDPRSKDFAKITVGNSHFDLGAGFGQVIRLATSLSEDAFQKGQDAWNGTEHKPKFGEKTEAQVFGNFIRSKTSPIASFAWDYLDGKDMVGQPFSLKKEAASKFVPLFLQDYAGLVQDEGWGKGSALAVPALFGVGVQTYQKKDKGPQMGPDLDPSKPFEDTPSNTKPKVTKDKSLPAFDPEQSFEETTKDNVKAVALIQSLGIRPTDKGVRSHEEQQFLYDHYKGVAKPGTGHHEDGRAVDFHLGKNVNVVKLKKTFTDNGYKGVKIITKPHGHGLHGHIQWDSYDGEG